MSKEIKEKVVNKENDVKENLQVGEAVMKTAQFIERNKKRLIIIISAIVVVIVALCMYFMMYIPSQEKAAANAMFAAEQYYTTDDYEKALKGDGKHLGFIAVSDEYSSTKAGKLASYYVGRIYLEQGKFQQAIDYLKKFNPDDAFMSSQVKVLIADAYIELNQLDKAISYYEKATQINPNDFNTAATLQKLAYAYEMKKDFKKALDCYMKIKSDYPTSPEYATVEKYISRMNELLNK